MVQKSTGPPCSIKACGGGRQCEKKAQHQDTATENSDVSPHNGDHTIPHTHLRTFPADDPTYWHQHPGLMIQCAHLPVLIPPGHWGGGAFAFQVASNISLVTQLLGCQICLIDNNTPYEGTSQEETLHVRKEGNQPITVMQWPNGACVVMPPMNFRDQATPHPRSSTCMAKLLPAPCATGTRSAATPACTAHYSTRTRSSRGSGYVRRSATRQATLCQEYR